MSRYNWDCLALSLYLSLSLSQGLRRSQRLSTAALRFAAEATVLWMGLFC